MSQNRATGDYDDVGVTQVIKSQLTRGRYLMDICKRDGVEDPHLAAKVAGFEEGWQLSVQFKTSETRVCYTTPTGKKLLSVSSLAPYLPDGVIPWGCQKDCQFTKAEADRRLAQLSASSSQTIKRTAAKEEPKAKQEPKVKQEAGLAKPARETKETPEPRKAVKVEPMKDAAEKETRVESKASKKAQVPDAEARVALKRERGEEAAPAAKRSNGSDNGSASTSSMAGASTSSSSGRQLAIAAAAAPIVRPWMTQPWVKVPHPRYRGIYYYFNEETEESVWDRPQGAPA